MDSIVQIFTGLAEQYPWVAISFLLVSCLGMFFLTMKKLTSMIDFTARKRRAQEELIKRYVRHQH